MSNGENKKADEIALELLKQLITLSSGVLALSATFISKLELHSLFITILIGIAWLLLLISILFSIQSISCIVQSRLTNNEDLWSKGYGRTSGAISKYSFIIGIAIFVLSAFLYLQTQNDTMTHKDMNTYIINNSE